MKIITRFVQYKKVIILIDIKVEGIYILQQRWPTKYGGSNFNFLFLVNKVKPDINSY